VAVPSGTPCDQAVLRAVATHAIWNEKVLLAVRLYKTRQVWLLKFSVQTRCSRLRE
jgi:hypothetical protein